MTDTREFIVGDESAGVRLDRFLVTQMPEFSRSEIQSFTVTRAGAPAKFSDKVKPDDKIVVQIPSPTTNVATENISDELDSFLASVGTKVDLTADLPTKENLQKVFKYAYTLSNDFSNLIDFLRDERERASDSDWARHALAIKESGVLKTNTFTNRFTQWLSFFGEMFGRVVAYQEPNKLRRSKSASDISIYFPKHVG